MVLTPEAASIEKSARVPPSLPWPTSPAGSTGTLDCAIPPPREDNSTALGATHSPVTVTEGGIQEKGTAGEVNMLKSPQEG